VLLFEAVLGVGAPYTTGEREPSWPEPARRRDRSRPRARAATSSTARGALAGHRGSLRACSTSRRHERRRARVAAALRRSSTTLAELRCAGAIATPIGELETHVALDGGGRLACVRLRGDWIAAQPELQALEAALVGELPGSPRVRELCAAWLAQPSALVIGLTDAASLADSVTRSARAYSVASKPSSSA
jgi:hypothetical protein